MRKESKLFFLFLIILVIVFYLGYQHTIVPTDLGKVYPNKPVTLLSIGPSEAYPNPQYTPGLVATTNFTELTAVSSCGTYSKCHRKTTSAMKTKVCNEYPDNCKTKIEIDHFCPLALGCADDIKNLWAEPEHIMVNGFDYGFHTKDKLENLMVIKMKAGEISPNEAQQCILQDWVKCYNKYVEATPILGSVEYSQDQEDYVQ